MLSQLSLDADAIYNFQNAVNIGKGVTVSIANIEFNGREGCGYIVVDPNTGSGAYMISEGLSGAIMIVEGFSMLRRLLLGGLPWVDKPSIIADSYKEAFRLIIEGYLLFYEYEIACLECLSGKVAVDFHGSIANPALYFANSICAILSKKLCVRISGYAMYTLVVAGTMTYLLEKGEECLYAI